MNMLKISKSVDLRWILFGGTLLLAFLAMHQVYVSRAHPDAVFIDTLRIVYQWDQWREGDLSLYEYWSQNSAAHRGFVNQAFLIANIELFSLNEILVNRLTGVMLAIMSAVLIWVFCRSTKPTTSSLTMDRILAIAVGCLLMVTMVFGWAGFEVLTQDLGLSLWFKNLCFLLYFCAHSRLLTAGGVGNGAYVALSIAGFVIVFMVGMGWNFAFVGSVTAVHLGAALLASLLEGPRPPRAALLVTASLFIALLLYIATGIRYEDDTVSSTSIVRDVPAILVMTFAAIGAAWAGGETASVIGWLPSMRPYLGVISVVLCLLGIFWRLRRGLFTRSLVPLYMIAYGGLVAASVSIARGHMDGQEAVAASRYYMDVVFLHIGMVWLLVEQFVHAPNGSRRLVSIILLFVTAVLLCGQILTYATEWKIAPYRRANFERMNEYLLSGVPDQEAAVLLQAPIHHARLGSEVMRKHKLSIFKNAPVQTCGPDAIKALSGWHGRETSGRWLSSSGRIRVPACECPFVLEFYLPDSFSSRIMSIVDGEGQTKEIELLPGAMVDFTVAASNDPHTLSFTMSATTLPSRDIQGSSDLRKLGALWTNTFYACPVSAK